MKHKFLTILFALLFCNVMGQIQEPVQWSITSHSKEANKIEITYIAHIDTGWHIYDQALPENGPVSTQFVVESQSNIGTIQNAKANKKPIQKHEAMFDMDLRWYENEVTFTQVVSLTNPDDYSISGYVEFMACNDNTCLPPSKVPFSFEKHSKTTQPAAEKPVAEESKETGKVANASASTPSVFQFPAVATDTMATNTMATDTDTTQLADEATWQPVIDELNSFGNENVDTQSLWSIFLIGLLGGLLAIVTPCVWPIIPMTVSFFLHKQDGSGKRSALLYGLSIIFIYVGLGLLLTILFGADALNDLSTNKFVNIFLFLLLLVFAISFFGGFDLTLPSSWSTKTESKADQTTGILSILLMAFTLVIVSFSCTGPIIGTLLVHISTKANYMAPIIGMLGFAVALAGPFTLFALFPNIMKKVPRSGGWMNCVKVMLGFFELAFSLKFLSVADIAYGWHLLDREVFLAIWIAISVLAGVYLLGKLKFKADEEIDHVSVTRLFGALACFSFAIYLVPGLWGAPLKAISAFAPPAWTQDFNLYKGTEATFTDYDEAIQYAKKHNKPLLIDFSGYGCVNCREMEAAVWNDPQVKSIISEEYVLVSLYMDDKTALAKPIHFTDNGKEITCKTVGEKWSYLQQHKFGKNAMPLYIELTPNGQPLNHSYAFSKDVTAFKQFLEEGLKNFKQQK